MGAVVSVWTNAINDLRDNAVARVDEDAEKDRDTGSGVRWGLLVGWMYQLFNISWLILTDKTQRGLNVTMVMVFICHTVITYSFVPTVHLLTKLVKYGLIAGATFSIRSFFRTIGEETCQAAAGFIWTVLQAHLFNSYRVASFCMRVHTCDPGSYFTDVETAVLKICEDETSFCVDFLYNVPWILLAVIVYFANNFLFGLWAPADGNVAGDEQDNPPPPNPPVPAVEPKKPMSKPGRPAPTKATNTTETPMNFLRRMMEDIEKDRKNASTQAPPAPDKPAPANPVPPNTTSTNKPKNPPKKPCCCPK